MQVPNLKGRIRAAREDPVPTRLSLLSRLKDWGDQDSWKDFFDTYWRLIYSVAIRSGLTDAEAQDVVQETVLTVAKEISTFKRDPARGSFKGWLRRIANWRIRDHLRKRNRHPAGNDSKHQEEAWQEAESIPDSTNGMEQFWEEEWQTNLWLAAIARVKAKVDDEQFQMFDLHYVKEWPVQKVARVLRVSMARVYIARHRVSALVKTEIEELEKDGF